MKKTIKKEIGITLIALVITIIVLLILVGITIATLTGENGLLNKASTAGEIAKKENAKERLKLELLAIETDKLAKNEKVDLTILDENKAILQQKGIDVAESGTPRDVSLDGYTFKVNNDLTIVGDGITNIGGTTNPGGTDTEEIIIDTSNKKDLWTNWIVLAGVDISDHESTDILSNTSIMNTVMNNENAVKYMKESIAFIVPAVANSEVAMKELAKSHYLQETLKNIEVMRILRNSSYISELENNLRKNEIMSSEESDNAKVFASSIESGQQEWKAFDGLWNWENGWISGELTETTPQTLTYQFKNEQIVPYKFVVMGNNVSANSKIGEAYIEASKDGEQYYKISEEFSLPVNTKVSVYPDQNIDSYSYFRIVVTKPSGTYGRNKAIITEMEIYGK